nr:hypothetical protein 1 [Totiviridae sp.]
MSIENPSGPYDRQPTHLRNMDHANNDKENEACPQHATTRRVTAADLVSICTSFPEIPLYREDAKMTMISVHDIPDKSHERLIVLHERHFKTDPCLSSCEHPNQGKMHKHTFTDIDGKQIMVTEHTLTEQQESAVIPETSHLLDTDDDREFFNSSIGCAGYFDHDKFTRLCTTRNIDETQRIFLHRRLHRAINAHVTALNRARRPSCKTVTYFCSMQEGTTRKNVLSREKQQSNPKSTKPREMQTAQSEQTPAISATTKTNGSDKPVKKQPSPVKALVHKIKTTVQPAKSKEKLPLSTRITIVPPPPDTEVRPEPITTAPPMDDPPVPNASTGKETDPNTGLLFNGDIEQCWQGIYHKASADPNGLSPYDIEIRSLQWGWIHCVSDAPTTIINRRIDSSTEANCREIAAMGNGLKDQLGTKEVNVPVPAGGKGMVVTNSLKIKRREDGLSARARKVADDLRDNPARIRGFLAHGHANRKWTTAVCRYLRKGKGIIAETDETSKALLKDTTNKAIHGLTTATRNLVTAWATKDVGPILEKKDSNEDSATLDKDIVDESNSEQHASAVYTSARTAGILSAVHHAKVCIHCLLANTASPLPNHEGKFTQFNLQELRSLNLTRMLKSDAQGYLEACAAIHNREQHALNGNIHFTAHAGCSRQDTGFAAIDKAYSLRIVRDTDRPTDTALINVCENNLSKANFYTDGSKHSVIPSSYGTLYQYSHDGDLWNKILPVARDRNIPTSDITEGKHGLDSWQKAIILRARMDVGTTIEYETIDEFTLMNAAVQLRDLEVPGHLRPKYTSVHTLPTHSSDQIGLTMAATERIANSSAFASGGIGINDQRAYNITNYSAGANTLLGSALKLATTDTLDWRELGLKAAILEACREASLSWPTGQEWAIPKKAVPRIKYYPTIDNEIEAVVVSINYIDACLRENNGLKVRVNGIVEYWNMNDANLRVVSLNEDTSNTELTRSLRTVLALPFPVVNVIEEFQIKHLGERPNTYAHKCFYRNASLVAIGDKVERIVYIIPDRGQTSVRLGGTTRPVACPTRFNVAETVPDVWQARETILHMIHAVMGCGRNLRVLCNEYLSKYAETPLNWNEVETLCGALITRFPRQPSVYFSNDPDDSTKDVRYTFGLPKRLLTAYNLRGYTPQDEHDAMTYGHSEAITCFSQLLLDNKELCEDTCHLSIGRWSNYVEVLLSAGVAMFTPGSSTHHNPTYGLKATGIDTLNRISLIRRSVEEWASSTGMSEYVLNPQLFPRFAGNARAYISGGGNNPSIIILRAWTATCIGDLGVSWYWNANYEKSVPLAPNHRRLGSAMYQTDYTLSFRTLDLPPRRYLSNNTIGSRGYGWVHLCSSEPHDDYEIEKYFSRLDYHKLNEWGYLQWPDGNVLQRGSYMISNTVSADLAANAGWRGFNDSYGGIWGWGVDYMLTNVKEETLATLAIRPTTLSRVSASVFVPGLWQSIGIGLDASIETTSSLIDRMRGFCLAAQPKDGSLESQLEILRTQYHPTRCSGVVSNTSTTELRTQSERVESANIHSHHGALPSPMQSSNPIAEPLLGQSQNTGPQEPSDQTTINKAVPPTLKPGTDAASGIRAEHTARVDMD